MSTAKHTPGEWKGPSKTSDGMNWSIGDPTGNWDIALVEIRYAPSESAAEANARLLVSAPDLLALATQYRDDMRHSLSAESRARRLELIESVIAKAEGRTP